MRKTINFQDFGRIISTTADSIASREKELNQLDSFIGDGDHGKGVVRGFEAAIKELAILKPEDIEKILKVISVVFMNSIGGAMGPLLANFYKGMAEVVNGKNEIDTILFSEMISSGLEKVKKIGKAQPGDKTMVDAIQPAANSLKLSVKEGEDLFDSITKATQAAFIGANSTTNMIAKFGRAKYLGERSLGYPDPGAFTIYYIFKAVLDTVNSS